MKRILLALVLFLVPALAQAQCNGVFPANTLCGKITTSGIPGPIANSVLTGVPGGSNGQVQYNNNGLFGGLTPAQLTALINPATGSLSGAVPAWPNDITKFFRGDGTYAVPPTVTTSAPGYVPTAPNVLTQILTGLGTFGQALAGAVNYNANYTGGVVLTLQQYFDDGPLLAASFGVTCDGTTVDATNMDKFLAAVAVSRSKRGIVSGTSTTSICNMSTSQFLIRQGTHIACSRGVTLKFATNGALVAPYNPTNVRTFQGVFEGCTIDGTSIITFTASTGIDLFDASDWVIRDTIIANVNIGLAIEGNIAAYYNRIQNVVAHDIRSYAFYLDPNANSNTLTGVRGTSVGQYGFYCRGNQNTFVGVQIETGFALGFATDGNCVGSTITGMRIESGAAGVQLVSGANFNAFLGLYCTAIVGTAYQDSGTGNTKTGGTC